MLNNKTKLFLTLSIILIAMIGISAVSAVDVDNATTPQVDTTLTTDVQQTDNIIDDTNKVSEQSIESTDSIAKKTNDMGNSLTAGEKTIADLNTEISEIAEGGTLVLSDDYTESEDTTVSLSEITIDGDGHTIDFANHGGRWTIGTNVVIKNLVFQNYYSTASPLFFMKNGTFTLDNVTVKDSDVSYSSSSSIVHDDDYCNVSILNSKFDNISCYYVINEYGRYSNMTIEGTVFNNITARYGALRIYVSSVNVSVDNSNFTNINSSFYGGAIYSYTGAVNITGCVFENNTSGQGGGAIYVRSDTRIINNTFIDNTAYGLDTNGNPRGIGGAIYINRNANQYISGNIMSGNIAFNGSDIAVSSTYRLAPVNVTVLSTTIDSDEPFVLTAYVTDDMGNSITGGTVTFTMDGNTYTASVSEGIAVTNEITGMDEDSYVVSATYSNAAAENQTDVDGTIVYGSILPPMTDYTSLQSVLDSSEEYSLIKFKNNIERADSETKVTINKSVTINGKEFTIDANQGQIFEITNGATLLLANATLTDVNSAYGMFKVANGNLLLENVKMDNSTVTNNDYLILADNTNDVVSINNSRINNIAGNLIYNLGAMVINNTVIASNTGVSSTNGLIKQEGVLLVSNSNIENNTANAGIIFAINTQNGPTLINNVTFINNTVNRNAIVMTRYNSTIDKSVFINNTCNGGASSSGALLASRDTLFVNNSVFINNVGSDAGVASATYGIYKIENSILLRNDSNVFFYNENEDSAPTAYANWYGTNNPTNLADAYYDYDDFYDEEIMALDVVVDNWRIMNVTVTPTAEDNFVGIADVTFNNLTDDEGTITTTEDSLPDGFIDVAFEATVGVFDENQVTVTGGHAENTYRYSMEEATLTFTANDQVIEIDVPAPEIDPSHYTGLQIIIDSTAAGETLELTEDVSRTASEDNVTITKDITIDGKGITVDAKGGKIFRIENAVVTLKNMILTNMSSNYAPAVYGIGSKIILDNVTITNGTVTSGYGDSNSFVYGDTATSLTIKDSLIENLTGMAIGSGANVIIDNSIIQNVSVPKSSSYVISVNRGNLTITDSVINNNSATQRGIYVTQPYSGENYVVISNSNFTNNKINVPSGSGNVYGILSIDATKATISNSQFINNTATTKYNYGSANGGAIANYADDLEITKSIFINNDIAGGTYGDVFGSTIYNGYGANLDISYSVIISNSSLAPLANGDEDNTPTANYNWWGSNNDPSEKAVGETDYYGDSCPSPDVSKWIIMNVTVTDNDDASTITTTFNKYTDSTGTVYDTTDSIPDGLEVTYQLFGGTLAAETTTVVDGVTTNTFTRDSDIYKGFVTQSDETVPFGDTEPKEYKITNTTYPEYFNEDGTPKWMINDGSTVKLSGLFTDKNFTINIPLIITTDEDQAILDNSAIVFTKGSDNSKISDIQIVDTNYAENVILLDGVKDITIENMTINQYNDEGMTHAINLNNSNNIIINNNSIYTVGPDSNTVYDDNYVAHSVTSSITGYNTNNNMITNNFIVTNKTEASATGSSASIYGIDLVGNAMKMDGSISAKNNTIDSNTVITQSSVYNYGITLSSFADNNKVTNNEIIGIGEFDAHGIQLTGQANYNVIENNTVDLTANEVTYGLYISTNMMGSVMYNNITNNSIIAKSHLVYGMELWLIQRNNIIDNIISAEGNYTLGIGTYSNKYDKIINNTIDVIGFEEGSPSTMDNILAETSGIKLTGGTACNNVEVSGNIITVDSSLEEANAVNLSNTANNKVIDNYLFTQSRMGDDAVDGDTTTNTVRDNRPSVISAIITDETYPIYFDDDGYIRDIVAPNAHLEFSGEFFNKDLFITIPVNITTHEVQADFKNTTIVIMDTASGTNVTDIIIFNENHAESAIVIDGAGDITIENITIDQYNTNGVTHSISLYDAYNVIIENNTISTVGPDLGFDWSSGTAITSSISGVDVDSIIIRNNTVVTMANGEVSEDYGTINGIELAGSSYDSEITAENNIIENNTVYTVSAIYNYGISLSSNANNNKVINNSITGESVYDAHGIQLNHPAHDNLIDGNVITLTSNDVAYGIYVSTWGTATDLTNNNITNNIIVADSSSVYGMELSSVSSNIVANNTINATGDYALGIAVYGSSDNVISDNNITVIGVEENDPITGDLVPVETTGIKMIGNSTDSSITNNNINVASSIETTNAIIIDGEGNNITDNYLDAPANVGDDAVVGTIEDNTVKDNLPVKNESVIEVTANTPVKVNDDVTIDISLSANGTQLADRIVTVTIGDEEPFDLVTLEDGTVQYVYTPTKAGELNISVSFAGDRTNKGSEDDTTVVVKMITNIKIIDVDTVKIGENVIVNVVLTDMDGTLLSDKEITLTVDEKTLTETTENGVAKFTLSFDDAGDYEVVATYEGDDAYEGTTGNLTILVEALNTIIEANATNVVKYGANVTINGIIKDENGVLLEGIEAIIYVNGINVNTVTTDADGAFTYDYTTDTIGLNDVLIVSLPTNNYNSNDYTMSFGVDTLNVTITGADVTGTTLTDVTIVVSVEDENGNAVHGGTVVFTDANGKVLGSADVVYGSASITTVFTKAYDGAVTVTYGENSIYSAGEGSVNAVISKIASTVTIDPVEGVIGEVTTIVANVVDANGNPVNGGKVVFKYNGKTLKDADGNVVQANVVNGVATVDFVVPDSWRKAGNLSAKYGGTSAVDTSDSETVVPVIALRNATITVAPQANTAEAGDNVIYVIVVSDEKAGTLINGVIVVKMAGVTIGTVDVVNGVAMFNYTIPTSRRAGDYNMSFVFSNSSYNRAEYDNASLTVELSQVRLEAPAVVVKGNETGVVKAKVLYTNTGEVVNTPISVAIKVNGKTLDSSRYSDGNIEFELPASYKDGSTITIAVGATYRTAALRKDIQYIKMN